MNMYLLYSQLFSLLLILGYYSIKTKSKAFLWLFGYLVFLLISGKIFHILFPRIPFDSPTPQYAVFLVIVGIPFLVMLVIVSMTLEKEKAEGKKDWKVILSLTRNNLIFWGVIILINLLAFIMGKGT